MKNNILSALVGILFALGLGISGMTQPQKIYSFLDIFGAWDPSLVFVMGGALIFHAVSYRIIRKRQSPLLDTSWHVPEKNDVTPSLIIGAFLFGAGWALAGYCPGPALVSLVSLQAPVWIFVGFMFLGMLLFKILDRKFQFRR